MSGWAWVGVGLAAWTAIGLVLALLVGKALRRCDERAYRNLPGGVPAEGDGTPDVADESVR